MAGEDGKMNDSIFTFSDHGEGHPDYDAFVRWLTVEQANSLYDALVNDMTGKMIKIPPLRITEPITEPWKITCDGTGDK